MTHAHTHTLSCQTWLSMLTSQYYHICPSSCEPSVCICVRAGVCLCGSPNTWRAKQSNLRSTHTFSVTSAVAAPCIREACSFMHQCIWDFTQAALVCILISFHPQQSYCMYASWAPDLCIWHQHWSNTLDTNTLVTPQMANKGARQRCTSYHFCPWLQIILWYLTIVWVQQE